MLLNDRQHRTHLSYEDYVRPPSAKPSSWRDRESRNRDRDRDRDRDTSSWRDREARRLAGTPGSAASSLHAAEEPYTKAYTEAAGQSWLSADTVRGTRAAAASEGAARHDRHFQQPQHARQAAPLSWAVAELESGLVALQQMLKPHAELLQRQHHAAASELDSSQSTARQRQQTELMRAAIASAEAFADSVVETATAAGTRAPVSEPLAQSHTQSHRQHQVETERRRGTQQAQRTSTEERHSELSGVEDLLVTVDLDALIDLGPPPTGKDRDRGRDRQGERDSDGGRNAYRNGVAHTERLHGDHSINRYAGRTAQSPPAHHRSSASYGPTTPVVIDQRAVSPDRVSGSARGYGYGQRQVTAGRLGSASRSAAARGRSLSPPASAVKQQEYERLDPPAFLDLAPRERRDQATSEKRQRP